MQALTTKRIGWVDIGKAIAILCVVYAHSISSHTAVSAVAAYSFHMPLFFIFAGYTFKPKPMRVLIARSSKRLLVPYVLLSLQLSMAILLTQKTVTANTLLGLLARGLFASAVGTPLLGIRSVGMIWFLVALFFSRVTLNYLLRLSENWRWRYQMLSLILACLTVVGIIIGTFVFLPFSLDVVPLTTLYMFVGYFAKEYKLMERKANPILFLGVLAFWCLDISLGWFSIGQRAYGVIPISIIGAVAGTFIVAKACQVIERVGGPICAALTYVGTNSMLVFAFHYFELNYMQWNTFPLIQSLGGTKPVILFVRLTFILLMVVVVNSLRLWPGKHNQDAKLKAVR